MRPAVAAGGGGGGGTRPAATAAAGGLGARPAAAGAPRDPYAHLNPKVGGGGGAICCFCLVKWQCSRICYESYAEKAGLTHKSSVAVKWMSPRGLWGDLL
jgi:hypothetical protein